MKRNSMYRSILMVVCLMMLAFLSSCDLIGLGSDASSIKMLIQTDQEQYLLNEDKFVTIEHMRNESTVPVYMQALRRIAVKLEKKTEDGSWKEVKGWWNYEVVTIQRPILVELLPDKDLSWITKSSIIPQFSVDEDIGSPGEYRTLFFIYDSEFDIGRGETGTKYLLSLPNRISNTFYIVDSI